MAGDGISVRAVKRRLRAARRTVRLLDQELQTLAHTLPCPSVEDFTAMLSLEAPLTEEASLLGLVNLGQVYLAEAGETLSLALSTTAESLRRDEPSLRIRPDFRRSLGNILANRAGRDAGSDEG